MGRDGSVNSALESVLRSDLLPNLLGLLQAIPALKMVSPAILQVRVIIDASIVQGELRWRLKRRRKPDARTALHESLACGVLVGYAPHYLEDEIHEHAERLAAETGTSVADVHREWAGFRGNLCFYTARARVHENHVDTDDSPYLDTMEEIAAQAIYSPDRHFLQSDLPLIRISFDTTLQKYARASVVRVGMVVGSSVPMAIGIEGVLALARILPRLVAAAKRLPPAAQLLIVAAAVAAVAHPKARAKLIELWKQLIAVLGPAVSDLLMQWFEHYAAASKEADATQQEIEGLLPPMQSRPLIAHARAICLAARRPLRVDEIVTAAISNGYVPRSERSHIYLRRVLRADSCFTEMNGAWAMTSR